MRFVFLILALAACTPDETVSGFADQETPFTLVEWNGAPTEIDATISFGPDGAFSGRAPCNRYFGKTDVPYPWFRSGPIGSTRMACAALSAERLYFEQLHAMTLIEVSGPLILLTNDDGARLLFRASAP